MGTSAADNGRAVPSRIATHLRGSDAPQPPCEPTGSARFAAIVKRCARAVRDGRRARVVRPSPYRTTTTPRKNAAVFSRGDSRHEKKKAFLRKNPDRKNARSERFRDLDKRGEEAVDDADRRDARHRSFTSRRLPRRVGGLSMTAALAPRNTTQDRPKIPSKAISPHRETRLSAMRFISRGRKVFITWDVFARRSVSLRLRRPGRDDDPPRVSRAPVKYVRLRAGGRSRTPLTCWRP